VVWAAKQILEVDDHPFDPIPYVMLSGIPLPGRLWPMSLVDLLRGPQTELNKLSSQIAENRNRVGNPTIVASKQAVQDPDKFADATTMPGGIYFFDDVGSPNSVPQYLQAPPLPNYVIEEYQRIEDSIAEISGQHEVTSAQVPPGVTAASAINLLQEADDTRLGPAIADYEVQLGRLGQKCLNLVANFYTDARTIRLAGENGSWEIFDFRGSMLRDNTSVQVQTGSAFPQSKAAKQAALQDLLTFFVQSGNPPHGRALGQFLRDFDMGGAERLIEDYTRNEEQVNRENSLLAQGVPLQINSFDDDQAHIDGHEDEQKSARYARFPPQVKQVFEQHVLAHRQRLADQQQQMIQQQMQMQGQSPEQMAQQQAMQQAQQQQQMTLKDAQQAQQQGYSAASSEQEQRQSEELHQQKLRHQEEAHQQRLRQQAQQAQQQPRKAA
jgi:flagellar biosynthesis GTPase FlhF